MRAKDFRQQAWAALKGKWKTAVLSTLIFTLLAYLINALPGIGSVAAIVLTGPLTLGYVITMTKILHDEPVDVANTFDGFKNFLNSFVLYVVNALFVTLWSLLLVIPGIIKAYAYSMSYYILKDNPEMNGNDARKASIEMMRGHKWELFCLELSFIGWIILSSLTFGILLLWVKPYMETARVAFYEKLKNN